MEIRPIDDRILVTPDVSQDEKSKGGIILPESAREKPTTGTVIAVGTDAEVQILFPMGSKVLYGKHVGDEFEVDGKKCLFLRREDVIARL